MNRTPRTENLTRLSSEEARQRIARGESESDWARVNAIPDDEIGADDPDALPMTDEELATAPILRRSGQRGLQKLPPKQRTTLRLSADVLAHFRADGAGWQTRINDALKQWIAEHGER